MNKIFFVLVGFAIAGLFSCAKTHYAHPTPGGVRLQSVEILSKVDGGPTLHEIYNISYDEQNRVSQFIYTADDSSYTKWVIKFSYDASTNMVYKSYYLLKGETQERIDSFMTDFNKQIIQAWTPYATTTYAYNGALLYELTSSSNTPTLNGTTLYTSHNGDFFKSTSTINNDSSQTFVFYETLANRPGDYLWLTSFLTFGSNIYANAHLIRSETSSGYTNNISYQIDGQSKIVQTNAVITDSLNNVYTYTYNLAYESY